MKTKNHLTPIRISLGILFLMSGIPKFFAFQQLAERMTLSGFFPFSPDLFLMIAIFIELSGAISLLTSYRLKWTLPLLIIFVTYATVSMHTSLNPSMHLPAEIVATMSSNQLEILKNEFITANIIKILGNIVILGSLLGLYIFKRKEVINS